MKEFFERNKSIFLIGSITLILFVILIIVALKRNHQEPGLKKIEDSSYQFQFDDEETNNNVGETKETTQATTSMPGDDVLEISYTEKGFSPMNTKAEKNQWVRWTNKTDKDIYLVQKTKVYQELNEPVLIKAHSSFEYKLTKDRLWTYEEKETRSFGSIYVMEKILK